MTTPHTASAWSQAMLGFLRPPGQTRDIIATMRDLEKTCWQACVYTVAAAVVFICEAHQHTEGHPFEPDPPELAAHLDRLNLPPRQYEAPVQLAHKWLHAYITGNAAVAADCARLFTAMSPSQRGPLYYLLAALTRSHVLTLTRAQNYALHRILTLAPQPDMPKAHLFATLHAGAIASHDERGENTVMAAVQASGPQIAPQVTLLCVRTLAAPLAPWAQAAHPGQSCNCELSRLAEDVVAGWVTSAAAGTPGLDQAIMHTFTTAEDDPQHGPDLAGHLMIAASSWLAAGVREHAATFQNT